MFESKFYIFIYQKPCICRPSGPLNVQYGIIVETIFFNKQILFYLIWLIIFLNLYFRLHKEIPTHFDFFSNFLYLGETRVFSPEATAFCKHMVEALSNNQEKYEALYSACKVFEQNRQLVYIFTFNYSFKS